MTLEVCLVLLIASGAVAMDLRFEKVWNPWIWLGWGCGFLCQLLERGIQGIIDFAAGGILPILLLFPLFLFRMLGAGDIKLLSALGGFLGCRGILLVLAFSFLWGGLLSAGFLLVCKNGRERLCFLGNYVRDYLRTGIRTPYRQKGRQAEHIHFTIPILLGMLMYAGGFY